MSLATVPALKTESVPLDRLAGSPPDHWAVSGMLIWRGRRFVLRTTAIAFAASLLLVCLLPKRYDSVTQIMPPDQGSSGGALALAALARGGGLGSLGGLAGGLLGGHTTTALFIDLLHSGTVSGRLIDRFHLQQVYGNRYRLDTAKRLARNTTIADDKKSGTITIKVRDTDPVRARDLAQAYLDELNRLVLATNNSSAHQERVFIERRLRAVEADLEQAQVELSDFSSKNGTIDIREQTRAVVEAGAKLQGELLVQQAELQSLRQIYGDGNVRVHEAEAGIGILSNELKRLSGSSTAFTASPGAGSAGTNAAAVPGGAELYPPLRQLPRLAVPYADLYRRVKVQEAIFELLTQQYETSRIEEAKDVPVVSVIDPPGVPERKAFPPRILLTFALTGLAFLGSAAAILLRDRWNRLDTADSRKVLATEIFTSLRKSQPVGPGQRGAA